MTLGGSEAMEVNVLIDDGQEGTLDPQWLARVAEEVLVAEGVDPTVELGVVVTGQENIQELNLVHLGRDEPTDVLAFPMLTGPNAEVDEDGGAFVAAPDGLTHLGEVIISYPQAVIQAGEHGHSVEKEAATLVVHGVLHLLGYDHEEPEPEQRMRAREAEILARIEEKGL